MRAMAYAVLWMLMSMVDSMQSTNNDRAGAPAVADAGMNIGAECTDGPETLLQAMCHQLSWVMAAHVDL